MTPRARNLLAHGAALVLLGGLVGWEYRAMLVPGTTFPGNDWGMVHQPSVVWIARALEKGTIPLWLRDVLGGTPFLPIPDKPVLYPPLLAALGMLGDPYLALHVLIVLHVFAGAAGMYGFLATVGKSRAGAFAGAAIFARAMAMWLPEPPFVLGWAHMSMAAFVLARGILSRRPRLGGITAGAVLAHGLLSGGIFAVFYAWGFLGILGAYRILMRGPREGGRETLRWLLPAVAVFTGIGAVRWLPAMLWLSHTSRAGAVGEAGMRAYATMTSPTAVRWFGEIGWVVAALAALALVRGGMRRERWLLAAAMGAAMLAGSAIGIRLLSWVPGLNVQREGLRASLLFLFGYAGLAGLGFGDLASAVRARAGRIGRGRFRRASVEVGHPGAGRPAMERLGVGMAILLLIAVDFGHVLPERLRLTPPRHEVAEGWFDETGYVGRKIAFWGRRSVKGIVASNLLFSRLAAEAGPLDRLHQVEASDPVPEVAQVLSAETGTALLEGQLGGFFLPRLERFLRRAAAEDDPARAWGVLGVRWVSAATPRGAEGLAGLEKVATLARDPRSDPPFADGPYLYRNTRVSPAAWLAREFEAVDAASPGAQDLERRLLLDPRRPWRRIPVLELDPAGKAAVALSGASLAGAATDAGLVAPAGAGGAAGPPREASSPAGASPLTLDWTGPNAFTVRGEGLARGGIAVIAEAAGMWPGWQAHAVLHDGARVEVPLLPAQVVATGIPVPPRTARLEARYRPPGFVLGAVLAAATALLAAWAGMRERRGQPLPHPPRARDCP